MSEKINSLRDSAAARWTALLLLSLAMFCSYIFMDILSPIKDLMQSTRGWDSSAFGTMQGSETFLNVFIFFLIFAGIILDKMGVRFTAILSGFVMLVGALIKWYAVSGSFIGSGTEMWFANHLEWNVETSWLKWLNDILPFYEGMPASAKVASVGFMIFGCGVEMAGITVSRGIVKWFKGREMAMAMGSEMALARLGVATCMIFSPLIAKLGADAVGNPCGIGNVSNSVAFGVILLMVALMMFVVYFFMDKKLDAQTGEAEEKDDPFRLSDLKGILTSWGFWLVALLCVLYYSAIFPFQKYAVNMLQCNLTLEAPAEGFWVGKSVSIILYIILLVSAASAFISNFQKKKAVKYSLLCIAGITLLLYCYMGYKSQSASSIFAVFPLLLAGITPILGKYVDTKGKAASMLMIGSILLIVCHLTFAFVLPMFKVNTVDGVVVSGSAVGGVIMAYLTILVLGASFSLVPASLWPSVPKLVSPKVIGSAYALIFWIQNIGLWLFPTLGGKLLDNTNPGITDALKNETLSITDPILIEKINNGCLTLKDAMNAQASNMYDYKWVLVMFACLGVAALVISIILKGVDKKKGLGLELPNVKK